jgi:hypothetical protein
MLPHCERADREDHSDIAIRLPLSDPVEDFVLAIGESGQLHGLFPASLRDLLEGEHPDLFSPCWSKADL